MNVRKKRRALRELRQMLGMSAPGQRMQPLMALPLTGANAGLVRLFGQLCGRALQALRNDRYTVIEISWDNQDDPDPRSIIIQRLDGLAGGSWREFQELKNQVWGAEALAVEFYPAQARVVDDYNCYHLWRVSDPARLWFAEILGKNRAESQPGAAVLQEEVHR